MSGRTAASLEALREICRETAWSLGDEAGVLTVWILQHGRIRFEQGRAGLWALVGRVGDAGAATGLTAGWASQSADALPVGTTVAMEAADFARICD